MAIKPDNQLVGMLKNVTSSALKDIFKEILNLEIVRNLEVHALEELEKNRLPDSNLCLVELSDLV
jgi:hypothetical protein